MTRELPINCRSATLSEFLLLGDINSGPSIRFEIDDVRSPGRLLGIQSTDYILGEPWICALQRML